MRHGISHASHPFPLLKEAEAGLRPTDTSSLARLLRRTAKALARLAAPGCSQRTASRQAPRQHRAHCALAQPPSQHSRSCTKKAISPVIATVILIVATITIGTMAIGSFSSWSTQRTAAADTQSCAFDAALVLENVRVSSGTTGGTAGFEADSQVEWNLGSFAQTQANSSGFLLLNWTDASTNTSFNSSGNYTGPVFDANSTAQWTLLNFSSPWNHSGQIANDTFNTTGLVLLMHFNNESFGEYNGSHFQDNSTAGMNGSCVGTACPTYASSTFNASGMFNQHAIFDGSNDNITMPDSALLNLTTTITFSAWFNPRTMLTSPSNTIVAKGTSGTNGFYFSNKATDGYGYGMADSGVSGSLNSLAYKFRSGYWNFWAMSFNSTSLAYCFNFFCNSGANSLPAASATGSRLQIGASADGNHFNGSIDEVAVWNRSLSVSELRQLYTFGAARLGVQVRSCDDAACAGEAFTGPDSTITSYFNESPIALNTTIAPNNRYFQYRFRMFNDNASNSPNISNSSWIAGMTVSGTVLTVDTAVTGRLRNQGRIPLSNFTADIAFANGSIGSFPAANPAPTDNLTPGAGAPMNITLTGAAAAITEFRIRPGTCPRLVAKATKIE